MRRMLIPVIVLALTAPACGGKKTTEPGDAPAAESSHGAASAMPGDDVHKGLQGMPSDQAHAGTGVQARPEKNIRLDDAVRAEWVGIRVKVVTATGGESTHEIGIGETQPLGDTGLTLTAQAFVPDFVMDAAGITTRSPEPNNPGAKVVISEQGKPDFTGWLFAAMPDIHPFAHDRYEVILVEGIRAK